jgi:hypothetical protein
MTVRTSVFTSQPNITMVELGTRDAHHTAISFYPAGVRGHGTARCRVLLLCSAAAPDRYIMGRTTPVSRSSLPSPDFGKTRLAPHSRVRMIRRCRPHVVGVQLATIHFRTAP